MAQPSKKGNNIKVYVRIRPANQKERAAASNTNIISRMDDQVLIFDPSPNDMYTTPSKRRALGVRRGKDLKFVFDRVFSQHSMQMEVYQHTTKNLIDGVLNGYNATVFAYGATGAGKTYTMLGSDQSGPGVQVLTTIDLFKMMNSQKSEKEFRVTITYLEIYNEQIRDLLVSQQAENTANGTTKILKKKKKKPSLLLLQDPVKGMKVQGLSEHHPETAEEVMALLRRGNTNRMMAGTAANEQSSRSHAVFQILVESRAIGEGVNHQVKYGKLSLIDLAGSERASETKNRGIRLTEGGNINKSLLALANCINALGSKKKSSKYVPYRNSKLTRLLKDSLGGNCRTVMISNVSPSDLSYEDTYNTLKYASRAKNIKTKVVRNIQNVSVHLSKYRSVMSELEKKIDTLKNENQSLKEKLASASPSSSITRKPSMPSHINSLFKKLQEVNDKEINIRTKIGSIDDRHTENKNRIHAKLNKIRDWEMNHAFDEPIPDPPLQISTLLNDCDHITDLDAVHLMEKEKLEDQLDTFLETRKQLLQDIPHACENDDQQLMFDHDMRKHHLECANIKLEALRSQSAARTHRTHLLLEYCQNVSQHIMSLLNRIYQEHSLMDHDNLPRLCKKEYIIAKQWLQEIMSMDPNELNNTLTEKDIKSAIQGSSPFKSSGSMLTSPQAFKRVPSSQRLHEMREAPTPPLNLNEVRPKKRSSPSPKASQSARVRRRAPKTPNTLSTPSSITTKVSRPSTSLATTSQKSSTKSSSKSSKRTRASMITTKQPSRPAPNPPARIFSKSPKLFESTRSSKSKKLSRSASSLSSRSNRELLSDAKAMLDQHRNHRKSTQQLLDAKRESRRATRQPLHENLGSRLDEFYKEISNQLQQSRDTPAPTRTVSVSLVSGKENLRDRYVHQRNAIKKARMSRRFSTHS
mmetsp:Transcript_2324/g.3367  ORF Transcript_2324/g.3367 Transcript_2324/m.3367 type:complete len:921 (+) Transcript_2324:100-2862(+)|eukprot:CAMPEP_0117420814 /NCGR_PEP_ID=MMETSP0758-20121206/2075_1 /TAXON_ID=63605 /ORGANISM="Percolomonas cosmopolitus, Strain AE-1 (ATCC 50343)" /LENGTH=920 /DNA_ID=CAMNT_0005202653 /DNA_START=52 /DNA_END=2814 /DNA_ORIENTATION=+